MVADTWDHRKQRRRCPGVEQEVVRILAVREAKEAKNLREASYNTKVSDTVLRERLEKVCLVNLDDQGGHRQRVCQGGQEGGQ